MDAKVAAEEAKDLLYEMHNRVHTKGFNLKLAKAWVVLSKLKLYIYKTLNYEK